MRGSFKHQGNFRDTTPKAFTSAQVERHSSPAAGVYLQGARRVRFGVGFCIEALFLPQTLDVFAPLPTGGVLPASGGFREGIHRRSGTQHLDFFGLQLLRVEGHGFLHSHQCQQLQQVVLDHVTRSTDAIVVACPAAQANIF